MTPPKTPNRLLRNWREARGWTRLQMADALSDILVGQDKPRMCDPKLIEKWESGAIRWPIAAYRHALKQLTGHDPTALGFTPPTPRSRDQTATGQATPATGPAAIPTSPPTDIDLHAVDDLAALAGLLHARGYTTHLATTLPILIIDHPDNETPLHITATGSSFCWGGVTFCPRPPAKPLATAADLIGMLPDLPSTPRDIPR